MPASGYLGVDIVRVYGVKEAALKAMAKVYLGLGSNLGDREGNIAEALRRLSEKVHLKAVSSIYETEPVGYKEQPWFLNAVCVGETELEPEELLSFAKGIEREMGREKRMRWRPRIIDIDILFHDGLVLESPGLTIPHPRLHQRCFVLFPLDELAPELVHPVLGLTVHELLEQVGEANKVRLFKPRGASCTK